MQIGNTEASLEKAMEIFRHIKYEDSKEKIIVCQNILDNLSLYKRKYNNAVSYMKEKQYGKAHDIFEEIEYMNSAKLMEECEKNIKRWLIQIQILLQLKMLILDM